MNRKILMAAAIVLAATSCQLKVEQESNFKHDLADVDNKISLSDCDITFDGVRFTKSLNGGDSLVTINDSILNFDCEQPYNSGDTERGGQHQTIHFVSQGYSRILRGRHLQCRRPTRVCL